MEQAGWNFEILLTDEEILQLDYSREGIQPNPIAIDQIVGRYMTEEGVELWWTNTSWQLNEVTPRQAWEEGRFQDVLSYARGGLEQTAT